MLIVKYAILFSVVLLSACGSTSRQVGVQDIAVDDMLPVGERVLTVFGSHPGAAWQPNGSTIVVAEGKGFVLFGQGAGNKRKYRSPDSITLQEPQWLDANRVVIGSHAIPRRDEDGRVVDPAGTLRVAVVSGIKVSSSRILAENLTRPRIWGQQVLASRNHEMILVDLGGDETNWGEGFEPEPHATGSGLAWRDKPLHIADWWTAEEGNGSLIVRWNDQHTDIFADGCQPSWGARGDLCFTKLTKPVEGYDRQYWRQVPTELWYQASAQAEPQLIAENAHSGKINPVYSLIAYLTQEGGVVIADLSGGTRQISSAGAHRLAWSADGESLMVEQDDAQGSLVVVQRFAQRIAAQ